jgi:MFS family permease
MQARPAPQASAYAHYVLGLLSVVYVFNFVDRQILAVLLVDIQADLQVSDTLMGVLGGPTFALFYTLAGIPIARWADAGTRRTVVATGLAVWSVMTALCGLAQSYVQLLLARVGVAAGEAAGTPPSHALISDYYPPERRARALGVYGIALHLGILIGLAGGGWLSEAVGWRRAFMVVGVPGVLLALLVRLTIREPERGAFDGAPARAGASSIGDTFRHLFSLRAYRWLVIGASLASLPGYAFSTWAPTFMRRVHELSASESGAWVGLATLGGALGTYLGGEICDRLGRRDVRWYARVPALAMLASVPLAAVFLFWPAGRPPLLVYAAFLLLGAVFAAPCWAMFQALAPPHMRAQAAAIQMFVSNLVGLGAGPLVVGALNDLLAPHFGDGSIRYALLATAGVAVFAGFTCWSAGRTLERDLAPVASRV